MEVGILHVVQNFFNRHDDSDIMDESLRLADLYEPAGFDFCLYAEHHFDGYSMGPVPFDFLSYMAGRTSRIRLGPGVIIIPWNDPYRAAAHMISLDYLSKGRAILGFGRGLSQIEMDHFGIDLNDTRAMYDEGARKIQEAVTTGVYPGGGRFYNQQDRSPMRPAPRSTDWADRTLCVGMSPASAVEAGRLGGRLMAFGLGGWEAFREGSLAAYLAAFRESHPNRQPRPMVLNENVFVHEDRERAFELASLYIGNTYDVTEQFYGLSTNRLDNVNGYEAYATLAKQFAQIAHEEKRKGAVAASLYGTPADVLEKLRERRRVLDFPIDLCITLSSGDMPIQVAEDSLRLFGKEIIPVVHNWDSDCRDRKARLAYAE
jgi:alkanesulfonate monooxygenase SsuD/methylene tetrahydromethanopterin reductase-like flavin-dependent oxidoreductase (luciferase family)